MLTYAQLKDKPKEFLAATGLKVDEFERLLPAFAAEYEGQYPADKTMKGQPRQRQRGGGVKRCRIVKDVLRNTKSGFSDMVMEVACALHNLRVQCRHPQPSFQRE